MSTYDMFLTLFIYIIYTFIFIGKVFKAKKDYRIKISMFKHLGVVSEHRFTSKQIRYYSISIVLDKVLFSLEKRLQCNNSNNKNNRLLLK